MSTHAIPACDRIHDLGIVGAGGGGFPAAVKFRTKAEVLIVNGAECEPLLHKDKELLHHKTAELFRGIQTAMSCVGARETVIGIKEKYTEILESIAKQCPANVRVFPLTDTYPAGDEFILVHDVTGRVIPPGGLPKDVGAVVANVETLVNVGLDAPVTHKYLTVAGAVRTPITVRVPVGTTIGEVITAAGGATESDFGVLLGGVMMAKPAANLDVPVTKTTGGIVVLPASHKLLQRHQAKWPQVARIGRSACDQCSFCTELCPRYLLGHPIHPHQAMKSLGFAGVKEIFIAGTMYCCECNLCTMYSCPEDLDPKAVCVQAKPAARERNLVFRGDPKDVRPHPLSDARRVPIKRLIAKLGLSGFQNVGPLVDTALRPARVRIPLQQHAGSPAISVVKQGQHVAVGDLIGDPPAGKLGARIHASIAGTVTEVSDCVTIEAGA
jgi:Na+-translocating ferredoxin:NAD+ oxidoreductase RnfC subunit